jgi:methylmalonyl-CoA mutase
MKTNSGISEFEPVSTRAWKQKIQADLKGGDYNELLTWLSPEGISVKPFYTAEDLPETAGGARISGEPSWRIGHVCDPRGETGAVLAREALEQGAEAMLIPFSKKGGGVLKELLALQAPRWVDLHHLEPSGFHLMDESGTPGCQWMADPIGTLAASGNWTQGMEEDRALLGKFREQQPKQTTLGIHCGLYQNAGATRVQELGYSLAQAHEYAKWAEKDQRLISLLETPVFLVAVGSEYFFEIAKIRALRRLWSLLATSLGYPGTCFIIAMPSRRNKTLYDYNTNMLRSTMECMAAVLGGADLVCNHPYDGLYHHPNPFADRISRNQLLLLRHESYFSAVSNPADGAYYIESLTDQLGEKALGFFKSVDRNGGLLRQLKEHKVQKTIRESAAKEQKGFNEGRQVLVGSNKYPNPQDHMKGELEKDPFLRTRNEKTLIEPILPKRLSEGYEKQRIQDE